VAGELVRLGNIEADLIALRATLAEGGVVSKTAGAGYFTIPTGPAASVSIASGVSGAYGAWVQMIAATGAAIYVVGFVATSSASDSYQFQIGTGAAAAETGVGEAPISLPTGGLHAPVPFMFPIPVATGTRIAVRSAKTAAAAGNLFLTLIANNQADVV
jgi:hypothetical protein